MRRSLCVAVALWAACSQGDPTPPVGAARARPISVTVAHRDARLDVPSFVWLAGGAAAATARAAAPIALRALAPALRLDADAQAAAVLTTVHDAGAGPIIVEWAQRVGSGVTAIDVFRAHLRVAFGRDLRPVAASGLLAPSLRGAAARFALAPSAAITRALAAFATAPAQLGAPARTRPVYFPLPGDRLEPGHYVELRRRDGAMRAYVISAVDGRVLFDNDLVHHDAYTLRVYADPDTLAPDNSPYGTVGLPHPTGKIDGYRPGYAPSHLVTIDHFPFSRGDPWLPVGATTLTGNNVDAYADLIAPDGASPGDERAPGPPFDFSYDTAASAGATPDNLHAAITQLFYVTNFMHDWFYDAGFDEPSGNPQTDNFGRGGVDGDPLLAETEDYSGLNNSNAAVPSDGSSPRIQMFIFSGTSTASLDVAAPSAIAGTKAVGTAGFGSAVSFNLAGDVVLGVDGQGTDAHDGCEPLTNDATGKIVLVHRGQCSFVQKVQSAQTAGAIGVLVSNVAGSADPTTPPFMGGTASNVTIPSLSLNLGDGQAIEGALDEEVSVVLHRTPEISLDGALDANVSTHEWGHVLSNRLVGDGNGLTTNQAGGLGEGWSDFVALLVSSRPNQPYAPGGAGWSGVYPLGGYATAGQGSDYYFGIRRVPYSVDFAADPLTFQHIQNGTPLPTTAPISFGEDGSFNAEVHNTGEVWATMLWECYVGLLRERRVDFATAQERMKRYLVAALKLTPIDPTLLEARDALLAAALATDEADYRIFWGAFARRGAGVGAVGPDKASTDNGGVVESYAAGNDAQIVALRIADDVLSCDHDGILDEGERGTLTVTVRNDGTAPLSGTRLIATSSEAGVAIDHDGVATVPELAPLTAVDVQLGVSMHGVTPVAPITIDVNLSDPSFAIQRPVQLALPTRFAADEAADSSSVDHVDTVGSSWLAQGFDGDTWARVRPGQDGWWQVTDTALQSDHELRSSPFTLDGTTFALTFRHRWSFRHSQRRMVDVDGGVLEISMDDGDTWDDLSMYGTVDYNTTLDPTRTSNVLAGRRAYGNTSAGYPTDWIASHVDVVLLSHPASVRIRFRMGTAGNGFADSPGWEVDDIQLDGIASLPFSSFVAHRDACDPAAPVADAGLGTDVHPGAEVRLAGSGSGGAAPLHYRWQWIDGPYVTLQGADTPTPRFVAPKVPQLSLVTLALRVDDGTLLSAPSIVTVTVRPGGGCSHTGAADSGVELVLVGIAVLWRRRRAAYVPGLLSS